MNVYFLVMNEMMTGVIPSQVVAPARAYAAAFPDLSIRVMFIEPARVALSRSARRRLRSLRQLWPDGSIGLYPYIGRLGANSPAGTIKAVLEATGANRGPFVIHCRGPEATEQGALAAKRRGGRVVFDHRGAAGHEAVLRLQSDGRLRDTNALDEAYAKGVQRDRSAVDVADAVVAVNSRLLAEFGVHGSVPQRPAGVIPCCVTATSFSQAARTEHRRLLEIAEDELLLIHVSTNARWEAFDQTIALHRELSTRRRSRLLFLTTLRPEVVLESLAENDPIRSSIIVRSASHVAVPGFLSAADLGVLLRRPHEAHRYASPIKFAEYLAAGLVIVVSSGIGETDSLVTGAELGVAIDAHADRQAIREMVTRLDALLTTDSHAIRGRALELCDERFVWSRYTPVIERVYGLAR